ncbi:ATP-binding cassette domain-containing protein [Bacillus massiliigorillae]|uniref:ATP-binding cassette domain-containing protein n=1 Tax=Bacillus massiliigorillae TaxID=1243664 RepID=UPI00039A878A|nr:ABC transporter ATP-binding protein [Bacillus massiliigorillae]
MNIIQCKELTKVFWRKKVLNNMSFSIEENKITGLIGRNGAGKTTLLKIISGFYCQTSGEITVFSEKPFNSLLVSANSIYIEQEMSFPSALNLVQILEEASRFYPNFDCELAHRLFDYFSLEQLDYYAQLSKGMRSTFNCIIGIASRAELTIFDEPTNGMDAGVRKDFYRALLKDYLANPRTIILSSHHLDEIENLLEDILLMRGGNTLLHLPVSALKEYAVGLKGDMSVLQQVLTHRNIIYEQAISPTYSYVVIENDLTEEEKQELQSKGIQLSMVAISDLCVYLTDRQKGGIDDVFK